MGFVQGKIADKYQIMLTDERAKFHADRPEWEQENLAAIKDTIREGDTIYDIGAELGDLSCLYAKWSGGATVLVEPSVWYWPQIRGTFNANGLDAPALSFVGFAGRNQRPEKVRTFEDKWPPETEQKYQVREGFSHLIERPDIACVRIDDLAKKHRPDVIVIDVEGSEHEVLAGASQTLRNIKPTVFCSVHRNFLDAYGSSEKQLDDYMDRRGYDKEVLADTHEIHTKYFPRKTHA